MTPFLGWERVPLVLLAIRVSCAMNAVMHRSSLLSGLAILLAFGLTACNDDNIPAAPGGGGGSSGTIPPIGGSGGTGGSSGTGGGAGNGGSAGQGGGVGGAGGIGGAGGMGGGVLLGDCSNASDFAELASLAPSNARTLAASVTVSNACINVFPDRVAFNACVVGGIQASLPDLSLACSTCYADLAWCSLPNCNVACQNDSCVPICLTCEGYEACREALNRCTGRTPPECGET